jgi:SAM-dependent methyltransferase
VPPLKRDPSPGAAPTVRRWAARPTRGRGLLEPLLARLRAERADRLIPTRLRGGRILDIGCGSFPYFLSHTSFRERFGIEKERPEAIPPEIHWHTLDLSLTPSLPFPDHFFSAVTLLAVIEHFDPGRVASLFRESCRILEPGGSLVLTTPAPAAAGLLRRMARLRLVSPEEIAEHAFTYPPAVLAWYAGEAGFDPRKVKTGHFELRLNTWLLAER